MTARVRHCGEWCQAGITLGELRSVVPHTGLDRVPQVSVRFAHGVLELPAVELEQLLVLSVAAKVIGGAA